LGLNARFESSKSQHPNTRETSNIKLQALMVGFEIWNLAVGIWSFYVAFHELALDPRSWNTIRLTAERFWRIYYGSDDG